MTIYEVSAEYYDDCGNFHSTAAAHWRPICTNIQAAKSEAKDCIKQLAQFTPKGCHIVAHIRVMTDDADGRFRGHNSIEVRQ